MKNIQLVIWDLDDTVWKGTLHYNDDLVLKKGVKEALKEITKQGKVNAICSRNDEKDALPLLKKFDIDKYFKIKKINWNPKSQSIREIIEQTGIEEERALFIDDDAFQRAEVEYFLPDLNVAFFEDPLDVLTFEGVLVKKTKEDKNRVSILKAGRERKSAEDRSKDFKQFLKQCNLVMTIRSAEEGDLPRVSQLLNRTNELNTRKSRRSLEEIKEIYKQDSKKILVSELKDSFGEYGVVAEAIVDAKKTWNIIDLAVSCRTMGRGLGSALLVHILNLAKEAKSDKVSGKVKRSKDNWRIHPLYEKRGFVKSKEEGDEIFYDFHIQKQEIPPYPKWLAIN